MGFIRYETDENVGLLTIDRPEALNALNSQLLIELQEVLDNIAATSIGCLIITGAGEKAFVAGADIAEMRKLTQEQAKAFCRQGNDVMTRIEQLPMPVIAAINGYALGGGCELALCCDIRLAADNAVFGLPEVSLGITPGYGGLQRLSRIIGSGKARELAFTTTRIKAAEAFTMGLVDHIYPKEQLLNEAKKMAGLIASNASLAVQAAKQVMNQCVGLTQEEALYLEQDGFAACFETIGQRNAMNAFLKIKEPAPFTVGVIGAGVMGSGIALAFAGCEEYRVILCDVNIKYAETGKQRIVKKLSGLVEKGKMEQSDVNGILSRILVGEIKDLTDCKLVVEAVMEKMQVKQELFSSLQSICPADAIFASNTSALSLTEMASGLDRAIVGMHFFNPVDRMKLVEIIAGEHTSAETIAQVKSIVSVIGKTPVIVQESAGFVVNRLLIPMINEAISIYAKGIASADDIDTAMKLGANHPIGPLALGDLIGLDVCLAIMEVLQAESDDSKFSPDPLLCKMVQDGLLGRKTGKGFYDYTK